MKMDKKEYDKIEKEARERGLSSEWIGELGIRDYETYNAVAKLFEISYDSIGDVVKHIEKLKGFSEREKIFIALKYAEARENPLMNIVNKLRKELKK